MKWLKWFGRGAYAGVILFLLTLLVAPRIDAVNASMTPQFMIPVIHLLCPNAVIKVNTIADLKNLNRGGLIESVKVLGYSTPGDGGDGDFHWDSSDLSVLVSSDTKSGIYVGTNTGYTASPGDNGAWVRIDQLDIRAEAFGGDINAAISAGAKRIRLTPGASYTLTQTLNMAPNLKIYSGGVFDQSGSSFPGLARVQVATGFSGNAIEFSSGDVNSQIQGMFLDLTNQESGDGIAFLTDSEVRNMNRLDDVVVYRAADRGVFNAENYKGNVINRLYIKDSGSHGYVSYAVDSFVNFLWTDGNGGNGIYLPRSATGNAGGNRYWNIDSWGNQLNGIVEEQSSDTWNRTQTDRNKQYGLVLQNKANTNVFDDLKVLSGYGGSSNTYSAIAFMDGGGTRPYGNILNNIAAFDPFGYYKYLLEDLSSSPSINTVSNVTISLATDSGTAFRDGPFNPAAKIYCKKSDVSYIKDLTSVAHTFVDQTPSENLLINGDFAWTDFSGVPIGWGKSVSGLTLERVPGTYNPFQAHLESQGLVTYESGRQYVADVDHVKGRDVQLSGLIMVPSSNILNLATVAIISDSGNVTQSIPNDSQWHPINLRYTVPSGTTTLRVQVTVTGATATAGEEAYFSGFILVAGDPGTVTCSRQDAGLSFITFADGDTTPTIRGGDVFRTSNTSATTISSFTNATPGKRFFVLVDDALSTFDFSDSGIRGNSGADVLLNQGDFLQCLYDGNYSNCIVGRH